MISVGAYFKTVCGFAVAASSRHHLPHLKPWRHILGGVVGSLLMCSAVSASPLPAHALVADVPASTLEAASVVENGVYLYGSAPEADVLGATYMVFSVQDAYLVGAFFMPQSSFDCFQGQHVGNELALQITNSYTQEVYGYEVALVTDDAQVASTATGDFVMQLDGLHHLGAPGEAEMAVLATCQNNFSVVEQEL